MKRVIQICIICFLSLCSYIADAQQYYAWSDTLYVRIADSAYLNKAIEFDLEIYRPNNNWEAKDTILGDADFCFNYSDKAFSPSSSITFDNINAGLSGGSLLSLGGNFVSNQWIIIKTVLDNVGGKMLPVPLKQWVTLCRVKIGFSSDAAVGNMPGIVWDKLATGMMTAGGRPIYLVLMGDVEKHPDPIINLTSHSPRQVVECEGQDVLLYATGNSSGNALKFNWEYRKLKTDPWVRIGAFDEPQAGSFTIKSKTVNYSVSGVGDTIVFEKTSAVLDSMYFQCILSDASLPVDKAKTTPDIQMLLRDSLWGFLSKTGLNLSHRLDTITKCPASTVVAASFWLYGFDSYPEYNAEAGSTIHFSYYSEDELLNKTLDTMNLTKPAPSGTGGNARLDGNGRIAYYWNITLPVKANTKVWVNEIWTDYCTNGAAAPVYDSLFIKEVPQETYNLAKLTVEPGKIVELTPVLVPYDIVTNLHESCIWGDVVDQGMDNHPDKPGEYYHRYDYQANAIAGIDTVIYSYVKDGCTMTTMREVEVIDNYYLSLRVLLEGPYLGLDKTGKDSMVCVDKGIFDSYTVRNGKYASPYADSLTARVDEFPELKGGGTICDWIYIMLRDGMDGQIVDSTSAFIRQDGYIFSMTGEPFLVFSGLEKKSYHIIVKHRNHISVMSKNPVTLVISQPDGGTITTGADFTNVDNIFGIVPPFLQTMLTGSYALFAGDINDDGVVSANDRGMIKSHTGMGYFYDLDHSKVVVPADVNYSKRNNAKAYQYPRID